LNRSDGAETRPLPSSGIIRAVPEPRGGDAVTTSHGLTFTMATLSSPDPPALARFYARLLGWEVGEEEPGWVTLRNPAGGVGLGFHIEDVYTPPVWPSRPGEQLMMEHLEIRVDDLEAACAHAQACGATLADFQPQEDVRVHLDPDGHPFCLYLDT
jgi:catechol 2,3-dioxygenase-like lactoylglutathione lyase family enzyme